MAHCLFFFFSRLQKGGAGGQCRLRDTALPSNHHPPICHCKVVNPRVLWLPPLLIFFLAFFFFLFSLFKKFFFYIYKDLGEEKADSMELSRTPDQLGHLKMFAKPSAAWILLERACSSSLAYIVLAIPPWGLSPPPPCCPRGKFNILPLVLLLPF